VRENCDAIAHGWWTITVVASEETTS
jgi:hypothetical protein